MGKPKLDDWRDINTLRDIIKWAETLGYEEFLDKRLVMHTPDGEWFDRLMIRFSFDHEYLVVEDREEDL